MECEFDAAGLKATVTFAPLPAFCFDCSGRVAVWMVPRILWAARFSVGGHRRGRAVYADDLAEPRALLFLRHIEMTFDEAFWREVTAGKRAPLRVTQSVARLGRTSWAIGGDFKTAAGGAPLAGYLAQMVYVDPESRRPAPLPGRFRDTHRALAGPAAARSVPCPFAGGGGDGNRFRHEVTPGASSLDASRHVHQSEMVRFCSDALAAGLGAAEEEPGDRGGRGGGRGGGHGGGLGGAGAAWSTASLSRLSVLYLGEAFAGDRLVVESWLEAERPRSVLFEVTGRGRPLARSVWEFSDDGPMAPRAKL